MSQEGHSSIEVGRKAIYLSGPMAGMPELNRAAFASAEAALYNLGARFVFNPCEHYRKDDALPDWLPCEFMRHDLNMLTGGAPHRPNFDMMVLLDGWEHSGGAKVERTCAEAIGMRIHTLKEIEADQIRAFWEGR